MDAVMTPQDLDSDHWLDRTTSLHRQLTSRAPADAVELFTRAACTLRVTIERTTTRVQTRLGNDGGLAVRTCRPNGGWGFAASGGSDAASATWALETAFASEAPSGSSEWRTTPGILIDRDADLTLLPAEHWVAWLSEANRRLVGASPIKIDAYRSWVESALVVETWVGANGAATSRARVRTWAMSLVATEGESHRHLSPLRAAARRPSDLDPAAWSAALADRWLDSPLATADQGRHRGPVVFGPEASSALIAALVDTLAHDPAFVGAPCGPGFRVDDRPGDPHALLGGGFDDAGFPTQDRSVADGRSIRHVLVGPGHYRRGAFRDPPVGRHAALHVRPPAVGFPDPAFVATGLILHATPGSDWILELEGARFAGGARTPPLRGLTAVEPAVLLKRIVGGVGPPRESDSGVRTPALLVSSLDLALRSGP